MAITAALCNSYKQEILSGIHLSADTYNIALFTSSATLSKSTTAYSSTNEVANGGGYTTGGIALVGFTTGLSSDTAYIDWTTDPSWASATIAADGALIYNVTRSNKSVAVLSFGGTITSTNSTFLITLPAAGLTATVRIA
jgi:hypothetical protein